MGCGRVNLQERDLGAASDVNAAGDVDAGDGCGVSESEAVCWD
jgi:hypothetical protein